MLIIPAIDLKDGKCVRLFQGDMKQATVFSDDPVSAALRWEEEGAKLLHLVDLDGAVSGESRNRAVVREIAKSLKIPVEVGGGIRNLSIAEDLLSWGVDRVILGTLAYQQPELVKVACQRFPGKILVGIDAKKGVVAIKGWVEETGMSVVELARMFEDCGVSAMIFTAIEKDGAMEGPDIESTLHLARSVKTPIIASGGISHLSDVEAILKLEADGVAGLIIGKALYTGAIRLKEALALRS
ncbi:MAG: 1-(5-phosphoribosyl)-5-[(5-phosphoribosylamino)methylideneamino]imidazole-4-carboxamide isomerase [Candidatus Tectomicrobia bacterium]|nr:1-(5-phosphoribosyl)-5-[(5-phosphoribosylamino)methylideneamino]imidazole-4-carboxamide isomerase [Candidatus Tectomicrobia bacterium]